MLQLLTKIFLRRSLLWCFVGPLLVDQLYIASAFLALLIHQRIRLFAYL